MSKRVIASFIVVLVAAIALLFFLLYRATNKIDNCEARGGVMVRAYLYGGICIRKDALR